MKLDGRYCYVIAEAKVMGGFFVSNKAISFVDDGFDCFQLNTRSTVLFGWLMKLGRVVVHNMLIPWHITWHVA